MQREKWSVVGAMLCVRADGERTMLPKARGNQQWSRGSMWSAAKQPGDSHNCLFLREYDTTCRGCEPAEVKQKITSIFFSNLLSFLEEEMYIHDITILRGIYCHVMWWLDRVWIDSRIYWTLLQFGRSVKFLLALASSVIPDFSLLEIHDLDYCCPLVIYVFRNGASSSTREGRSFCVGATFVAP
jgi:hypothetical protein